MFFHALWNHELLTALSDTYKDLTLDLDSMEDHTPFNLCTPPQWTTTRNSHNLDLVISLLYLLNTNLGPSLNIYLVYGLHSQPLLELVMVILMPWWPRTVIITLVHALPLPYISIQLNILANTPGCRSSILVNSFTNPSHRYGHILSLFSLLPSAWISLELWHNISVILR